jgi:hypothetical protein
MEGTFEPAYAIQSWTRSVECCETSAHISSRQHSRWHDIVVRHRCAIAMRVISGIDLLQCDGMATERAQHLAAPLGCRPNICPNTKLRPATSKRHHRHMQLSPSCCRLSCSKDWLDTPPAAAPLWSSCFSTVPLPLNPETHQAGCPESVRRLLPRADVLRRAPRARRGFRSRPCSRQVNGCSPRCTYTFDRQKHCRLHTHRRERPIDEAKLQLAAKWLLLHGWRCCPPWLVPPTVGCRV